MPLIDAWSGRPRRKMRSLVKKRSNLNGVPAAMKLGTGSSL